MKLRTRGKVAVSLVVLAVVGAGLTSWKIGFYAGKIDSVTAEASRVEEVPGSVEKMLWEWNDETISRIKSAWTTDTGAVLSVEGKDGHGDGVVGLDTSSGEEQWHYRVDRDDVVVNPVPGRERVVLSYTEKPLTFSLRTPQRKSVTLDSATGNVLDENRTPAGGDGSDKSAPEAYVRHLTSTTRVKIDAGSGYLDRSVESYDLSSDELLWKVEEEGRCAPAAGTSSIDDYVATTQNLVIVSFSCVADKDAGHESEVLIKAFDAESGKSKWEYRRSTSGIPTEFVTGHPSRLIRLATDTADFWRDEDTSSALRNVRVEAGVIYLAGPGGTYVLDVENGKELFGGRDFGEEGGIELERVGNESAIGRLEPEDNGLMATEAMAVFGKDGRERRRADVGEGSDFILPMRDEVLVGQEVPGEPAIAVDWEDGTKEVIPSSSGGDSRLNLLAPGAVVLGTSTERGVSGLVGFG